jgi:hypothetical protein
VSLTGVWRGRLQCDGDKVRGTCIAGMAEEIGGEREAIMSAGGAITLVGGVSRSDRS